jgi:hypothetical protein
VNRWNSASPTPYTDRLARLTAEVRARDYLLVTSQEMLADLQKLEVVRVIEGRD